MSNLKALVDPRFNEDDVTVLLVKRRAAPSVEFRARGAEQAEVVVTLRREGEER